MDLYDSYAYGHLSDNQHWHEKIKINSPVWATHWNMVASHSPSSKSIFDPFSTSIAEILLWPVPKIFNDWTIIIDYFESKFFLLPVCSSFRIHKPFILMILRGLISYLITHLFSMQRRVQNDHFCLQYLHLND